MGCDTVKTGDGATIIICSRTPRQRCSVCNALTHVRLCDFVLVPAGAPTKAGTPRRRAKTCDAKLCPGCAAHVGPDRDLCPAHARAVAAADVAPSMLADPNPFAMQVVADQVERACMPGPSAGPPGVPAGGTAGGPHGDRQGARRLDDVAALHGAGAAARAEGYLADPRDAKLDVGRFGYGERSLSRFGDGGFKPRDRDDWEEFYCERAAIAEYVGGAPRAIAEVMARELAGPAPRRYPHAGPLFGGGR